jgi:hypothetical protein
MAAHHEHRTWTAVITVDGHSPLVATWSEQDQHDEQLLDAVNEALRLMRRSDVQTGGIDLFQDTAQDGNAHFAHHTVSIDERGIIVSAGLTAW